MRVLLVRRSTTHHLSKGAMQLQTLGFIQGVVMSSAGWLMWRFNHKMQNLCMPFTKVVIDHEGTGVPGEGKAFDRGLWQIIRERYW
jgi:hypothetical protein